MIQNTVEFSCAGLARHYGWSFILQMPIVFTRAGQGEVLREIDEVFFELNKS